MENNVTLPQDKDGIWGPRVPVSIDLKAGTMSAGNEQRPINIDADITIALSSYLSMVYELRSIKSGVVPLRKDDLDVLANVFEVEEETVAEKLARLMHCDDIQTKRFIKMIKTGRVLVPVAMVAAGALLAISLNFGLGSSTDTPKPKTKVGVEIATLPQNDKVDVGTALQVERAEPTNAPDDPSNDIDSIDKSGNKSSTQSEAKSKVAVKGSSVGVDGDAPFPGPGEVVIGDGIHVSRDDIQ